MPGTTRYSATFDRTYEEDDRVGPAPPANARRSRSQSLQTLTGLDGRPYTPLGPRPPNQRSSSTDSGAKGPDFIPTRTVAKTAVKAHNNPFQFVKVGTCPLYKKAEEQLQKTKEVKKQDVFREEEEEWQSNLDSWKSRRRKMSEDVFRRQEEIKQFELEEQIAQVSQKKIKTFSEMVESRAHRGRALSLCLISNPLEFQDWEFENKSNTNGSCSTFTDESEENSTVNSEDEGFSLRGRSGRPAHHDNQKNIRTNGDAHIEQNGSKLETQNGDFNNVQIKPKEGSYIDSGLESISSSHRAGDTPDSGSDFSQDSNSSIDCESPRTGVNILEEFNSKTLQMSGEEISVKLSLSDKSQGFGFQFQGGKDAGQVLITSVAKECSSVQIGDQIIRIEGSDVSSKPHAEIISLVQKGQEKGEISLLLWRHTKTTNGFNAEEKCVESPLKPNTKDNQESKPECQKYEKSIESENEMYVDDFEELQRQSELLTSSKTSETACTNSQAQSDGKISTVLSSDNDSVKSALVPKIIEPVSNGAVDKQNTNEKTDSEISTESPKKNIVKVKRVRRKGVYALDVSGTPNSIPQEGIPVGSLYPLSPVTELPSPADETKTISSTLSSKPTTPVSNSQNSILPKETEAKINSSVIKESNKTPASAPKSVISKTTVPSDESKINVSEKVESKIESSSVLSSPTVTKNKDISLETSVEEKPKLPSSPKKVKVKVKKANAPSEQKSPESPLSIKETPVTQTSDLSVKKLTSESQPKKEQKSDSVTNDKSVKVNKNENLEASPKMENNVSSTETAATKSEALSSSSNDKTPSIKAETSSKNSRNLSLKINTPNESANLAATPPVVSAKTPKTPVDEKSKPPFAPKKEKTKPKENSAGSTPVISEEKSISPKGKSAMTANDASVEKTKNISLKTDTQNESLHITTTSPVTSSKLPKTPQEEKAKPSLTQIKEKTKSKEISTLPVESAVSTKEVKSIELTDKIPVSSADKNRKVALDNETQNQTTNLSSTPAVQDIKIPKTPQDEKPKAPLAQKKEKIPKENNSLPVESAINTKEVKSIELKDRSLVTSADKNKKPMLVDTQNQATNLASTPSVQDVKIPKTPQDEKPKAPLAQKKEKMPKENNSLPVESAITTKEVKSTELKDKSPVTSSDKNKKPTLVDTQNQATNLASTPSVQDVKIPKTPQDEKPKAPLAQKKEKMPKENNSLPVESAITTKEVKSTELKDKSPVTSSDKNKKPTLVDTQNQATKLASTPSVQDVKIPKTAQEEKPKAPVVQKKEKVPKETSTLPVEPAISTKEVKSVELKDKIPVTLLEKNRKPTLDNDTQNQSTNLASTTSVQDVKKPKTPQDEKPKALLAQKKEKVPKENNSPTTETIINVQEGKSNNLKEKTAVTTNESTPNKARNLSLNIQVQDPSINLATSPLPSNIKQPKTPQSDKSKPSFAQKKEKGKSKGKTPDRSPDSSQETKETFIISITTTSSPAVNFIQENPLIKELNSLSAGTKENGSSLEGNAIVIQETKGISSMNKIPACSSVAPSTETKNLSLNIQAAQNQAINVVTPPVVTAKPPKTPQDEKSKPSFSQKKGKSKAKGKVADLPTTAPTQTAQVSTTSQSQPSSPKTVTAENEHHKVQKSGSLTDVTPVKVLNENNKLLPGIPTIPPEIKSTDSKEKLNSDKTKNLSLQVDTQKESFTLDATSSDINVKEPKTPQEEKTKPRLVRRKSKKGKGAQCVSPASSVLEKESSSNNLSCKSPETLTPESESHKKQNLGSITSDIQVPVLNETAKSSQTRGNNILPSGTSTETKSTASTEKSISSDKAKNLSLDDAQKGSVPLEGTPSVASSKQPKTPQDEKTKPRLIRKRSKSKGKTAEPMSPGSTVIDKGTAGNSLPHTTGETNATGNEPCEQNSGLVTNDAPVTLNESTESSNARENNILLNGTPTALPELNDSKEKSAAPNKTRNLSLKIEAQNEFITLDTAPVAGNNTKPKTPQGEKAKPRLARKRSKSKGKNTEQSPAHPSQVDKNSLNSSASQTSATETLVSSKEPQEEQKLVSVADDKPLKRVNEKAESSDKREKNDLSSVAPTALPKVPSTNLKEENSGITSSVKTGNLSLKINKLNEPVATDKKPDVVKTKQPKTPQDEKPKPHFVRRRERSKSRDKFLERYPSSDSFDVPKEADSSSPSVVTPAEKSINKMQPKKKQNGASDMAVNKLNNTESSQTMDNSSCAETADVKPTASKDKMSVGNIALDSDKTRNQTVKSKQPTNTTVIPPVVNAKPPQTDEKSKPPLVQKKENTKPKEKASLSLATSAVCANIDKNESQKSPSASVSSCNVVNANPSNQKNECLISSEASTKSDLMQSSMNTQENKSEPVTPKKTKTKSKKKNTNSQKVNSPAKQNEELTNLNIDSLNVIFQSESKNSLSENHSFNNKNSENNSNKKAATDLVPDIPPVEKVAEEMEKLILEQLEEEERAKELAVQQTKNSVGSPEHLLTAPPRLAEPPKEKPPPPPSASEGSQKDSSLKRVNSTKRIKKEIHKRRSNFLGIDNADESITCSEPSIPPPPALEEILKAEMELDRQSRLKIESAAIERLTLEEKEIMQKEREIIESLECEERQKQLLNGTEDFKNVLPTTPSDVYEDDRILSLKNERKRIETERFITEEQQQLNLLEEKQLREREEFIRKQEAGKSAGSQSDSSLSVAANAPNNSKPAISSLTETKPKVSLSDTSGDGGNSSAGVSENKSSELDGKDKTSEKPAVPPKPLKKKEAIRKERERLRQEQEALQREREEHRRKLMLEQEELMKQQKSHAPDAPVSQLGPLPPLVSPNFPPQLTTTTMNATPNARESASFPSRSHHGASNGTAGSINAVELMGPPTVRQNRLPASRKAAQNEAWGQQKMPSVRKQNHDSLTESRYNQNHWLIQEAEMRRISELKERQQRTSQLPCSQTHLAEDDVCSNSPRVPVITPTPNPHLNYAVQDKMWNYGQSSMPPKKYPPPVVKDPLHTVYPREAVSQQPPTKPSRVVPMERQEQMLSVSGRKRCSHCNEELGRGAAMIIESLQLYYHIHCFQCCVCQAQLGNGSCGTDVRVRNNKLHCHNCYSNDEAGLKFSQV